MALQLKQALWRFCVEVGWSYAVFWRLVHGRDDQMHLEWGDGHCERTNGSPGISGFEAMDMLLKKAAMRSSREGHAAELGYLAADRVSTLVNNIMVSQVHAIGDGLVGQAVFRGTHQWIFQDTFSAYGSIPKVLAELKQQFMAGIQTIAIVPVLPHGAVQLGSTKIVMEDIGFVNYVKNLFVQLVCVSGSHLSDNTDICLNRKIQLHGSLGIPVGHSVDPEVSRFKCVKDDQSMNHHCEILTSKSIPQHSYSLAIQTCGNLPDNAKDFLLTKDTSSCTVKPVCLPHQEKSNSVHHDNQVAYETTITQVRPEKPELRSIQNSLPHDSANLLRSVTSDLCTNKLTFLEEQLSSISCNGSHVSDLKNRPALYKMDAAVLKFGGCMFPNSLGYSNIGMLHERPESANNASDEERFTVLPKCATDIKSCKLENDLLKDLGVPYLGSREQGSCDESESLFGNVPDCLLSNLHNVVENRNYQGATYVGNDFYSEPTTKTIKDASRSLPVKALQENSASVSPEAAADDLFGMLDLHYRCECLLSSSSDDPIHGNEIKGHELHTSTSARVTQHDACLNVDASDDTITCSRIFLEVNPDQLLDAVISKISSEGKQDRNNDLYCNASGTTNSNSCLPSSPANGLLLSSERIPGEFKAEPETASISAHSVGKTAGCSETNLGHRSQMSFWVENGQDVNCDSLSAGQSKSTSEIGKLTRKRLRLENPRPRPKDRQLIQDRIKELRGIVPDGVKCSIDALLEKTIKHMLFLQSITKYADKLKVIGEPRIISKDVGLLLQDDFEGGATWAFEVGSRSMTCPIIVEDLNPPRQMLVEILCEERGLFLEIADLIRGLGLTILKGVMEARNAKVWARFTVEANRDVTRMEIFLSLVYLLEPTIGSSNTLQGTEMGNLTHSMPHSSGLLDCVL